MKKYLLSVDGGGTKTEFYISDLSGEILESISVGSSNYKSVGMEEVQKNFQEGLKLLESKGISLFDIGYSVWGISGCDSYNDLELLRNVVEALGVPKESSHVCNDGVLAFYAQATEPGIAVIAGTGSIILGIDGDGDYRRAGGWGYNFSDIGSGYWIGAEVLKHTLLYCDGCEEYSPLFDWVREYFNSSSFEKLPYIVTEVTDYYEVAKLSHLAAKGGEEQEPVSMRILSEGAKNLASLTCSIYRRLNFREEMDLNIVFSGGVLQCSTYQSLIKTALKAQISLAHVTFFTQENAPAYGGIQLAKRLWRQDGGEDE